MNDEDITKLAAKLSESLASKEDLNNLEGRLDSKINVLEEKVDNILKYVEGLGDTDDDHEVRLKRIENIPDIAQQLKQ